MDARLVKVVESAIKLKALGAPTSKDAKRYIEIDYNELGARLKANGGLREMLDYVHTHNEFTLLSIWESSPTAIQTLIDMRAEKNA